jgi:hypothetical protein
VAYIPGGLGLLFGAIIGGRWQDYIMARTARKDHNSAPGKRMPPRRQFSPRRSTGWRINSPLSLYRPSLKTPSPCHHTLGALSLSVWLIFLGAWAYSSVQLNTPKEAVLAQTIDRVEDQLPLIIVSALLSSGARHDINTLGALSLSVWLIFLGAWAYSSVQLLGAAGRIISQMR